jgi:hypothetical protein
MPLSALTMFISSIAMLASAYVVNRRLKSSSGGGSFQAQFMSRYFLCMGIFCFFMFLPHVVRTNSPENFPLAMAYGYTIGHIFCYAGFTYILRLTFSIVPRLSRFDGQAVILGVLVNVILTSLTAVTMMLGTQPQFDAEKGVTLLNVHPAVGIGIILYAVVAVVPAALLMLYNGFTNPTARLRSLLLGGGFLISMIAGPLHDNAATANVYMLADIITIFSVLVTTSGVLYRIEDRISVARPVTVPVSS